MIKKTLIHRFYKNSQGLYDGQQLKGKGMF